MDNYIVIYHWFVEEKTRIASKRVHNRVRNYVPRTRYPRNHVPRTLKTMYHVPRARNHVPSTLDTMYFYQKFERKK